jgi:hypothetical protein
MVDLIDTPDVPAKSFFKLTHYRIPPTY